MAIQSRGQDEAKAVATELFTTAALIDVYASTTAWLIRRDLIGTGAFYARK